MVWDMVRDTSKIPHQIDAARNPQAQGAYLQHAAQALGIAGLVARNSGMPA